jgi:hypothetical protein
MHTVQETYSALYDAMLDYEGPDLYADVVRPWASEQDGEREWLKSFADRPGSPIPEAADEDLWRLYAFSRIVDLLQLGLALRPGAMSRVGGVSPIFGTWSSWSSWSRSGCDASSVPLFILSSMRS